MNTVITINGQDHAANITRSQAARQVREFVEALTDWKSADVFVANFPARGRALSKQPGFTQLGAHG